MATATARNARNPDSEDCITHVQCDGLVRVSEDYPPPLTRTFHLV